MQTLEQLLSGELEGARKIKLCCGLEQFPEELFSLAGTLEYLDLTGNRLSALPLEMDRFSKLKIIFLSENRFTEFPRSLSGCKVLEMAGFKANKISFIAEDALPESLRWLILTDNLIEVLPQTIGKCSNMQKLMLAGNRLAQLPSSMSGLQKLELLRISANRLTELPSWLFTLPRLSWLAISGNSFNQQLNEINPLKIIPWQQLNPGDILGSGASGIIYKAVWNKDQKTNTEVALKIFKGNVTSDGLPGDEMKACIEAGAHASLVPLIGKIANHPEEKEGLVLELIPPGYINLGGPPDLNTCTRDTFPEGTLFELSAIVKIVREVASVCNHLHLRGIMHGDLYAHNILFNDHAHPLLSDFGAASYVGALPPSQAVAAEKLEVRAFGCLLEDLLMHVDKQERTSPVFVRLDKLARESMQESPALRPGFTEILARLQKIYQ